MSVRQKSMMVWAEGVRRAYETDGIVFEIPRPGLPDALIWETCHCWECQQKEWRVRERAWRVRERAWRAAWKARDRALKGLAKQAETAAKALRKMQGNEQ